MTGRRFKKKVQENIRGYSFISLALVGMLLFRLGPMLESFRLSFTAYDILTPARWIGFRNFQSIFFNDPLFWRSLLNTAYYVGASVPLRLCIALMLAMLLNQKIRAIGFYRTLFYLPTVTSGVAVALLWMWVFEPAFGLLNNALKIFGVQGPSWLGDPRWSMPALIIVACWQVGQQMLIFLAGLQSVPPQLYEVAQLDGAKPLRRFFRITLPLLSPIVFFNMVVGIIQSFQMFEKAFVMTGGGPVRSTYMYVLYLYTRSFTYLEMGYGSALAWILFMIILAFTLLQFGVSRWVYYEGGSKK